MIQVFKIIIVGIALFAVSNTAHAQSDVDTTATSGTGELPELPQDELEVVKDFQARLAKVKAAQLRPELPVVEPIPYSYSYIVNIKKLALEYPAPRIKPIPIPPTVAETFDHGRAYLMYGYPKYSVANLQYANDLGKKLSYLVDYKHLAFNKSSLRAGRLMQHQGRLISKYTLAANRHVQFGIQAKYDKRNLLDSTQVYAMPRLQYGANIALVQNQVGERKLAYKLGLDWYQLDQKNPLKAIGERYYALDARVAKRFENIAVSVPIQFEYFDQTDDSKAQEPFGLLYRPRLSYHTSNWRIRVGADGLLEDNKHWIQPSIGVDYQLSPEMKIAVFAHNATIANSLNNLLDYNPYIIEHSYRSYRKERKYGLGIDLQNNRIETKLELGYKIVDDMPSYARSKKLDNYYTFDVQLEKAQSIYTSLMAKYALNSSLSINASAQYFPYNLLNATPIKGIPALRADLSAELRFGRIFVEPAVHFYGGIAGAKEQGSAATIVDLGLDFRYNINRRFDMILRGTNLLHNQSARWANYPMPGIALSGGIYTRL